LRGEFAAVAPAEPELVAHHLTQAALDEPAIEWWGKAGDQALRRSAFKEATAHLGKAIELADKLAATAPSAAPGIDRLHLQTSLGNALIWAKGYHAPATSAAFARARHLANWVEDASERFSAYYGPLGRASAPRGTRTTARNGRAFLARSHGPAELPRGCGRAPHFRRHPLLFRRFCGRP
jgi:hypothetical protein